MSSSSTSSDSNIYIATADSQDYLINPIDWNNITTHGVKDNSIPGSKIISIPVSKIVGDLPGGESKADVDASNLSSTNITAWQEKLEIDTLNALVNTKQDNLRYYNETIKNGTSTSTIDNTAVVISAVDIVKIYSDSGVNLEDGGGNSIKLAGINIQINGSVSGTAISTSIPAFETAVDTKLPSEKAVRTELDKKQDKLKYYSEVLSGNTPSATISVANIKLKGKVAEGYNTTASGDYSHAEGYQTIASGQYQHVGGKWNIEDTNNKYALIIGNGTSNENRSNALTVDWDANLNINGNATFPSDKKIVFDTAASGLTATYGTYIDMANDGGGKLLLSSDQINIQDLSTSDATTVTPGKLLVQAGNSNKTTITADKISIGENNWLTELGYGKLLIAGDGIEDMLSYGSISSDTLTHAIKLPKGNTADSTSFQIWVGTQAEYTALTSKDPSTMYFIVATDGTVSIKFGV